MLPTLVLAALGAGLAVAAWQGPLPAPTHSAVALGDHHDGVPLPPTHPLLKHVQKLTGGGAGATRPEVVGPASPQAARAAHAAATTSRSGAVPVPLSLTANVSHTAQEPTLSLRSACVWGKPGRNPYRGTVEQALNMAALPPEVVREIARQVHAKTPLDQLEISSSGIVAKASGRQFNAHNFAMTYGTTLCLGTRVNFVAGHTEPAALYEAADHGGRVYAVMVPRVCGNVSVLGQVVSRQDNGHPSTRGVDDPNPRLLPPMLEAGPNVHTAVAKPVNRTVPVPGTLVLVLAGLALLWRFGRAPET